MEWTYNKGGMDLARTSLMSRVLYVALGPKQISVS